MDQTNHSQTGDQDAFLQLFEAVVDDFGDVATSGMFNTLIDINLIFCHLSNIQLKSPI